LLLLITLRVKPIELWVDPDALQELDEIWCLLKHLDHGKDCLVCLTLLSRSNLLFNLGNQPWKRLRVFTLITAAAKTAEHVIE
jgi:hypothetical protein